MAVVGEELALDEAVGVAREAAAHHEPCKGGERVGPGAKPPPLGLPPEAERHGRVYRPQPTRHEGHPDLHSPGGGEENQVQQFDGVRGLCVGRHGVLARDRSLHVSQATPKFSCCYCRYLAGSSKCSLASQEELWKLWEELWS